MNEGKPIFDVAGMATAIRYTEYKDIYSAISEIVDNSIEAESKDIIIIVKEVIDKFGKKVVGEIGILDNGTGMDVNTLHGCLVFGNTTRKEHKLMGRFGVGLGQASMYAAPRVEVYSWQNHSEQLMVYLDADEMKDSRQLTIESPKPAKMASYFMNFVKCSLPKIGKFDFQKSGTFVLWKNVDKVSLRITTFYTNISQELGRRFRYYIDDGQRIIITSTSHSPIEQITPIDPLFIMNSSRLKSSKKFPGLLCKENEESETIFEPYISELTPNGEFDLKLRLNGRDGIPKISYVKLKCAVVREKYYYEAAQKSGYQSPGDMPIGKEVKKYERISVVRSGREIQFDRLDLYESVNDPSNRWWRIEINFNPDLDDFFTLSNNKQKIEIKTEHRTQEFSKRKTQNMQAENDEDTELETFAWKQLLHYFDTIMLSMKNRNKKLSINTRKDAKSLSDKGKISEKVSKVVIPVYQNISSVSSQETKTDVSTKFENTIESKQTENMDLVKVLNERGSLSKLVESIETDYIYDKKSVMIKVKRDDKGDVCQINKEHIITKILLENQDFQSGVEFVLSNIVIVRKQFRIYEEQKFFEKLIKELNYRFDKLATLLEGKND